VTVALKMIPSPVMEQCRAKAKEDLSRNNLKSWLGAGIIIGIWLLLIALITVIILRNI
jgi:hypothetical protein